MSHEQVDNVPCVGCGGTDLPLHTDYRCPDCHVLDAEVDEHGPQWGALADKPCNATQWDVWTGGAGGCTTCGFPPNCHEY